MFHRLIKYLKIILEPVKYSKKSFWIYFIIEIYNGFQTVFVVVIMSYLIKAIEIGDEKSLYFWIWAFIITVGIKIFNSIFQESLYSIIDNDIYAGLNKKYLKKYVNLDNTAVEVYGTGKINNIISSGISAISSSLFIFIDTLVELLAIIYIFILVLIKVPNIYYFVVFSFLFFLVLFLLWRGLYEVVKIRKQTKENYLEISRRRVKIFMSKFEIFQNHKIDTEIMGIKKLYDKNKKLRFYGNLKKSLWTSSGDLILNTFYVFIFVFIGVGVITKNYDIATFTLLIWMFQILSKYAWSIRRYLMDILRLFIDIEKLIDVFDEIPKYKYTSNLIDFEFKSGDIEYKNINFYYKKGHNILENFSLRLTGGTKTSFVGESGGGKSTLMKLLAGYMRVNSGKIEIDGQDIASLKLKSYYKNIGYLDQESSVFDGTIIENLLYALDYIPKNKEIKKVIKLAKCDFIYDLPKSLETEIGERGIRLSGGQKQRLAIAKIMLKNPKIIFLDEPTSALDSFNEELVNKALHNLFKGKTVIVVAHRLQTVKESDRIIFIENGKVVEDGTHKELIKLKGQYKKMLDLQSGF